MRTFKGQMKLKYFINSPSEMAAGLRGFTDTITLSVESGDPGGEPECFESFMRQALEEWYDGATVTLMEKS